jgi:hypothetical protein
MGVSCVRALLLCGAVLLWAGSARAGGFYSHELCTDAEVIADFFSGSTFGGNPDCEKLCKKTFARCKSYIARSQSCEKATVSDEAYWYKETFCDALMDPAMRKACRQDADAETADLKRFINNEAELARGVCDDGRDACISACVL